MELRCGDARGEPTRHLPRLLRRLADAARAVRAARFTDGALVAAVSGLYFLPSALFALALRPLPGIALAAGCAAAMSLIAANPTNGGPLAEPVDRRRLALAIAAAAALLLLGGETHLLFATSDWQIRDAVLADLMLRGSVISYSLGGGEALLRAPLGMYMAPAAVGRLFGLAAAHAALLAQNAALLGSTFYLLMRLGRGWPHLVVLVLSGGLSLVGASLRTGFDPHSFAHVWRWSLDSWHPLLQYSAAMVQFTWVPNHALPGWWLATLMILQARARLDVATLGVSVAALSFWSPLAVLPAVPWLLWRGCSQPRATLASRRTLAGIAAAAGFVPALAYMTAASGSIAHGSGAAHTDFGFWYTLFIALQVPSLFFLVASWRRIPRDARALVACCALMLLALPLFSFGPNNDLAMRGSIAALTVIAFTFGSVLLDPARPAILAAVGWAIVAACAPSAAVEAWRAVATPRYALSDCSLMQASRALDGDAVPSNYVADAGALPGWLLDAGAAAAAPVGARICWPDLPPGR